MNPALVGAFVLVLGALLVAGLLWLASGGAIQKKYDTYLAIEDESVAGLNLNAPVKYNGVDVGKVHRIDLDHADPQRVILSFDIERGTPVKEDTIAILKTQGITGITYVELSGGAMGSPLLHAVAPNKYPVIQTRPSLSARLENVPDAYLRERLHDLDDLSNRLTKPPSYEDFVNRLIKPRGGPTAGLTGLTYNMMSQWPEEVMKEVYAALCKLKQEEHTPAH